MKAMLAGLLLAGLAGMAIPVAAQSLTPMPLPATGCDPVNGLNFVCGPKRPEDLILIPGTRWLLNTGLAAGAGLDVIDTNAKKAYYLYTATTPKAPDPLYPDCPTPPDPASFAVHGIGLRATAPGRYMLYAISHGTVETVQMFTLDARGDVPAIVWKGCLAMPGNHPGNAVTSFADGSLLVTVLGGLTMGEGADAKKVGAVFGWSPGDKALHWIKGTELVSPNGVELSKDQKEFYILSTNDRSFHVYSRDGKELRKTDTPDFNPDNIRWNGDRLVAAGMTYDEPACGGFRQFGPAGVATADCHRGYMVAEIDPVTLQWKKIAYAEPNPAFDAITTGALVGDTLWLGTWKSNAVAWRPLPHLPGKP